MREKMKIKSGLFLLLFLWASPVLALTQSQLPPKFPLAWGANAGAAYIRSIPQSSQIGIQNCAASLNDGFPPLTFVPSVAGGCPPFGADFNGILKQITQWSQWQAAGGAVFYDGTFSTNVNGYPKGAIVQSSVLAGRLWFNTVDNNTTNPDSTAGTTTNWIVLPGLSTPGQPIAALSTVIPPGQVPANGLTVGNASSNATARANADTYWLFSFLWTNCAECQIFNSGGSSTTKGASASADFAANKAMATKNMNGTGLIGADQNGSALLSGVPIISGSTTVPGSFLGENLHALVATEIPRIITTVPNLPIPTTAWVFVNPAPIQTAVVATTPNPGSATVVTAGNMGAATITVPGTSSALSNNTGSGGTGPNPAAGNNDVQRSALVFWNLSL